MALGLGTAQAATIEVITDWSGLTGANLQPHLSDKFVGDVTANKVYSDSKVVAVTPWKTADHAGKAYNGVLKDGWATYLASEATYAFNILWGSSDSYNHVDFYMGTEKVDGISGDRSRGTQYVRVSSEKLFDKIVLRSDFNAFEYSFFSFEAPPAPERTLFAPVPAVPLPASGLLLSGGLMAAALVRLRRR